MWTSVKHNHGQFTCPGGAYVRENCYAEHYCTAHHCARTRRFLSKLLIDALSWTCLQSKTNHGTDFSWAELTTPCLLPRLQRHYSRAIDHVVIVDMKPARWSPRITSCSSSSSIVKSIHETGHPFRLAGFTLLQSYVTCDALPTTLIGPVVLCCYFWFFVAASSGSTAMSYH